LIEYRSMLPHFDCESMIFRAAAAERAESLPLVGLFPFVAALSVRGELAAAPGFDSAAGSPSSDNSTLSSVIER
jgi:hypothetical protein